VVWLDALLGGPNVLLLILRVQKPTLRSPVRSSIFQSIRRIVPVIQKQMITRHPLTGVGPQGSGSGETVAVAHSELHLTHPKYRADIDGLRAVAVLAVVGFHAFPNLVKGGLVGVDIFFVISGFLISTIIFDSLERNSFSFLEFYSRRIRRIFPALLLVLIASFSFGWFTLLADEYKQLGKHIAAGAGFVSNFVFWNESGYFDNTADTKPLLHLWSLGIEEQFYIVWPCCCGQHGKSGSTY
jgi:hypothetical protein